MSTIPPDLEVEIKSAEEDLVKAKIQLAKAEEYLGALELSRSIFTRHLEKVEERRRLKWVEATDYSETEIIEPN